MSNIKYYDKTIYQIEQKIKKEVFILIIFTISFIFGFFIGNNEIDYKKENTKELQVEINNLK